MTGAKLARAAEALCGVPFRLHGRDPASGLDCVGLLEWALEAAGVRVRLPSDYTMRNSGLAALVPDPALYGFAPATGPIEPGDVLLVQPGPAQFHLAIALRENRFVHAHAGLRRVVVQPGPLPGPIVRHWRLQPTPE